ncbi:MAG: hypothetical protein ACRC0R_00150, partial [Cetobacterium sp.]
MTDRDNFIERLNIKFGDSIELIGEYKKMKTTTTFKCTKCSREWNMTPTNLLVGNGCKSCSYKTKYTIDELEIKINKVHPKKFTILERINNRRIKVRCNDCGYEKESEIHHLLKGTSCNKCSGRERISNVDFINKVNSIHNNSLIVLDEY